MLADINIRLKIFNVKSELSIIIGYNWKSHQIRTLLRLTKNLSPSIYVFFLFQSRCVTSASAVAIFRQFNGLSVQFFCPSVGNDSCVATLDSIGNRLLAIIILLTKISYVLAVTFIWHRICFACTFPGTIL